MSLPGGDEAVQNLGIRFGFAAAIVAAFVAFLALGASDPESFAKPAIGPLPLSLVLATAMIVFAVAMTGVYVLFANRSAR